ncbi:class I lanthipeptide [Ferruginibacter sp. SUN106]|uniref:class I lanthipeptide n=1 Tax=Ferruginibacter sp. SUN106 TaxID=2978348 RepID=UPI003D3645E9
MKPKQLQTKLQLKKQAVSNLTNPQLNNIKGGNEEAWTTSKRACTGFLCCEPPPTINCSFTDCTACFTTTITI